MTDREAMKMALDVLERASDAGYSIECEDAIEALRQALAQPKQDDEAYGYAKYLAECIWEKHYKEESPHWRPFDNTLSVLTQIDNMTCGLEKAQPEQEPVATEKIGSPCPEFWDWLPKAYNFEGNGAFTKYNMEVAFLAGKNLALAQPEQKESIMNPAQSDNQEPVSHLWECLGRWSSYLAVNGTQANMAPPNWLLDAVKAATSQPRKEWVGLTIEEIKEMLYGLLDDDRTPMLTLIDAVQEKLKEKNT